MSVISFDDWRKKKARASALTSHGALRPDVSQREMQGFDLCVQIAEESAIQRPDAEALSQLWAELRALMAELPKEHGYFYFSAFDAFFHDDEERFYSNWDQYLESELRLFGAVADCDWWVDCFFWVFTPSLPGMYARCGEMFNQYWSGSAISWVCNALDQNDTGEMGREFELELLFLALRADEKCYLAHYLIASIYCEQGLYKSALSYFNRASASKMYREDAAFYFDFAWATEKAGQLELAIERYLACLALDERYPMALNNLGCVYMKMKKVVEAEKTFQKAIGLELDGSSPYRNMVSLYETSGRKEQNRAFIEKHLVKLGSQYQIYLEYMDSEDSDHRFEMLLPDESENDSKIARKRWMENWVESCIKKEKFCFGRNLMLVDDAGGYGRAYFLPGSGRIDLFCKSAEADEFYIIVVNGGKADERDLGKLIRQMNIAKQQENQNLAAIKGILFADGFSDELRNQVDVLEENGIELHAIQMNCEKI